MPAQVCLCQVVCPSPAQSSQHNYQLLQIDKGDVITLGAGYRTTQTKKPPKNRTGEIIPNAYLMAFSECV